MAFRITIFISLMVFCLNCVAYAVDVRTLALFDTDRDRKVPVLLYQGKKTDTSVVVINQGYGAKNTEYSFIANALATRGYFVVSIGHDLETDAPLARTGNLFEKRKPLWARGVKNILFVLNELKKTRPNLNLNNLILIGHSNGGDIAMMFATLYPKKVAKVISLDSRRYPFPSDTHIKILRFAALDDELDQGVVPNSGVEVIRVKGARHLDLCDRGSQRIKDEIQKSIVRFLGVKS